MSAPATKESPAPVTTTALISSSATTLSKNIIQSDKNAHIEGVLDLRPVNGDQSNRVLLFKEHHLFVILHLLYKFPRPFTEEIPPAPIQGARTQGVWRDIRGKYVHILSLP